MAINYTGQTIGKIVVYQDGKKFNVQLRDSNCLMCAIYPHKKKDEKTGKEEWIHELVMFFADEQHLKKCLSKGDTFQGYFYGDIKKVELNLYYKQNLKLLKHIVRDVKVTCYYEKPKQK